MFYRIALLLLLSSCHYGASFSVIKSNLNDAQYIQKANYTPNFSLFTSSIKNNLIATYQTNRLTNIAREKSAIFYQKPALVSTKLTSDTISIAYKINSVAPGIFLSNSILETKITTNRSVFKSKKSAFFCGLNISTPIYKNMTTTAFYAFPNHEFRIGNAIGISINYFFK